MTPEQKDAILVTFEPAARIYCGKLGIDPDERVPQPSATVIGGVSLVPMWHEVAVQLWDFSLKLTSLREGSQPPKTVN